MQDHYPRLFSYKFDGFTGAEFIDQQGLEQPVGAKRYQASTCTIDLPLFIHEHVSAVLPYLKVPMLPSRSALDAPRS